MKTETHTQEAHLLRVQLCLEDQRHRVVQSDPVREEEESGFHMQTCAYENWEHTSGWPCVQQATTQHV